MQKKAKKELSTRALKEMATADPRTPCRGGEKRRKERRCTQEYPLDLVDRGKKTAQGGRITGRHFGQLKRLLRATKEEGIRENRGMDQKKGAHEKRKSGAG